MTHLRLTFGPNEPMSNSVWISAYAWSPSSNPHFKKDTVSNPPWWEVRINITSTIQAVIMTSWWVSYPYSTPCSYFLNYITIQKYNNITNLGKVDLPSTPVINALFYNTILLYFSYYERLNINSDKLGLVWGFVIDHVYWYLFFCCCSLHKYFCETLLLWTTYEDSTIQLKIWTTMKIWFSVNALAVLWVRVKEVSRRKKI